MTAVLVADAGVLQQERDQCAGADHLRNHVKGADGQGTDGSHGTHRARVEAVGEHVRHGVAAGIAQRFGDDQQDGEIRDQPPDREHEAVISLKGDDAGDA